MTASTVVPGQRGWVGPGPATPGDPAGSPPPLDPGRPIVGDGPDADGRTDVPQADTRMASSRLAMRVAA